VLEWPKITTVRTGNSSRVELLLPIGVLQQLVEAIGRIPPLDYDKHGIAGVVSRFQIENLPLNGREFLRLAVLEPGVRSHHLRDTSPGNSTYR
jgi:hypothetical protein